MRGALLRTLSSLGLALFGSAGLMLSQSPTPATGRAQSLEFEVATIKPVVPNTVHIVGINILPGGRTQLNTFNLKSLIASAYNLSYWQISVPEPWMDKDEFDIDAKPADAAGITNLRHTLFSIDDPGLREMLQRLLADRFQLKVRRESKTGDRYTLQRTGRPLALRPSDTSADPQPSRAAFGSIGRAGVWVVARTSTSQIAKFAADFVVHAPVADETGIDGIFDYRQPQTNQDPDGTDPTDSFLRLLSEIGLKLERTNRGPVEALVVESASKPSEN